MISTETDKQTLQPSFKKHPCFNKGKGFIILADISYITTVAYFHYMYTQNISHKKPTHGESHPQWQSKEQHRDTLHEIDLTQMSSRSSRHLTFSISTLNAINKSKRRGLVLNFVGSLYNILQYLHTSKKKIIFTTLRANPAEATFIGWVIFGSKKKILFTHPQSKL